MKLILAVLCVSFIVAAYGLTVDEQWTKFKKDFTKNYGAGEEATRFEHFKKNLKFIEEHNAKFERGESGFSVAINELSDRTPEERKRIRGRVPSPSTQGN